MKPNLHRRRWGDDGRAFSRARIARAAVAAAVFASLMLVANSFAQTYNVTNLNGFNLIANQRDSPNGNSIANVIPSAPFGSRIFKWTGSNFFSSIFTAAGGWSPSMLLNPGDGLEFSNASPSTFVMTFSGNPHVPVLPLNLGPNLQLVARQTNGIANATNILGYNPPRFTVLYQFIPGSGHNPAFFVPSNYVIYTLPGPGWTTPPGPPTNIAVGESVWITTNGSPPVITAHPSSQTVCLGSPVTFTANGTGQPAPTFQWLKNGNPISGATSTSYTINSVLSSDAGTYSMRAINPFGTATSSNAVLTIGDNIPPIPACPPDKTVAATSPSGARVTFAATATDNCDPNPTITANPPSGSVFPVGTTPVVVTATDAAGLSNSCVFNVTVVPSTCCQGKFWSFRDVSHPSPRFGHAMTYDSARGRVVLFGGFGGSDLGDTWEWNGISWTQVASNGPSPRWIAAMAYDSHIGKTVLFGGYNSANGTPLGDTWLWNGTVWQPVNTSNAPSPRYLPAMAYDSTRQRSVLFGGFTGTAYLGDTWEFDGAQWQSISSGPVAPAARGGHVMAYDSAQNQLLLFGGGNQNGAAGGVFGDTWKWSGTTWTLLTTNGPSPRQYSAMVYNENCDRAVLFGGQNGANGRFGDTWEWNGNTWALVTSNVPPARSLHAMAHDDIRNQTVLFDGDTQAGDTWIFQPSQVPPQVISTYAACGDLKIVVVFSAPLERSSAENIGNYLISCSGSPAVITQAVLTANTRMVWLYLEKPFTSSPLTGCCTLFVGGVRDVCGNVLSQFSTTLCCTQEPCQRGSSGAEYWLTFPGNYAPEATNPPAPQLFIAGPAGAVGIVEMPKLPTVFSVPFTIPAGGVATVNLPADADLANANDEVRSNGIHVTASQPVSVYGHNHIRYTTDAYLGLSTKAIGQSYVVAAYQNQFTSVPELNGVQFAIAASQDNTTVNIVPSDNVVGHPQGVSFNLTLMQGETYQLRDTNDFPADLTGTFISADKPIAVFGSHLCANIPNSNTFFANHLVEQLPPSELWGKNFISVPLASRLFGDTFHIIAQADNTHVTVNGAPIPGAINKGKFFELQLTSSSWIVSDKPVLVVQYSDSSDYDFVQNSDPFMVLIPPTPFYASRYTIQTPTNDFSGNYLNLMVPTGTPINLDGAPVGGPFTVVPGSGFSTARIPVGTGPHTLFSSNNAPFGLIVYGWNTYDAYGYPGGLCGFFSETQTNFYSCPPTNITIQASGNCTAAVPDLTTQVGNGSSALFIIQNPTPGTLVSPGTYPISLIIVDQSGKRYPCGTLLTVLPSTVPGLRCPDNIVTNCGSLNGQYVRFQPTVCDTASSFITSTPPSGSLFPIGTNIVTCVATNTRGNVEQCTFTVTVKCLNLTTVRSSNSLTLSWSGSAVLQKASTITGPWTTIPNASSPYTLSYSGAQGFFRLMAAP